MVKVIILVGPPNSGKTTWCREFLLHNKDYVKISRDDYRRMLVNQWVADWNIETLITELQHHAVKTFLGYGINVILDNTHCKLSYINDSIKNYCDFADIEFKVFDIDEYTLKSRNESRNITDGKYIPDTVMDSMIKNFKILKENFDFKPIVH